MYATSLKDDARMGVNINTFIGNEHLINFGHAVFDRAVEISAQKFSDLYLSDFLDGCINSKYEIIEIAKRRAGEILAEAFIDQHKSLT